LVLSILDVGLRQTAQFHGALHSDFNGKQNFAKPGISRPNDPAFIFYNDRTGPQLIPLATQYGGTLPFQAPQRFTCSISWLKTVTNTPFFCLNCFETLSGYF
jgi:hypothetical protein